MRSNRSLSVKKSRIEARTGGHQPGNIYQLNGAEKRVWILTIVGVTQHEPRLLWKQWGRGYAWGSRAAGECQGVGIRYQNGVS
jgi:hypothetical protein